MRHIDDDVGWKVLRLHLVRGLLHVHRAVVGSVGAPAQDDMTVWVPAGLDRGDLAVLVATEEALGLRSRLNRVMACLVLPPALFLNPMG